MNRFLLFCGFVFFFWGAARSQKDILVLDSMYYVTAYYYKDSISEPLCKTFLVPVTNECIIDMTDQDAFSESVQREAYPMGCLMTGIYQMSKQSMSQCDSTCQKRLLDNNMELWLKYVLSDTSRVQIDQANGSSLIISVALLKSRFEIEEKTGDVKAGRIESFVPLVVDSECVVANGHVLLRRSCLHTP